MTVILTITPSTFASASATASGAPPQQPATIVLAVRITMDVNVPEGLLTDETTDEYIVFKAQVKAAITALYDGVAIRILKISEGSLIVDYELTTEDTDEAVAKVIVTHADLAQGKILVPLLGQNVSTLSVGTEETTFNQTDVITDSVICDAFISVNGQCGDTETCTVTDSVPACTAIPPSDKADNLGLALGLGIGIPIFTIIAILLVCSFTRIKWKKVTSFDSGSLDSERFTDRFHRDYAFPTVISYHSHTEWKDQALQTRYPYFNSRFQVEDDGAIRLSPISA